MAAPHTPEFVTPLVALLYGQEAHYAPVKAALEAAYGPVDLESEAFPFDRTEYYEPQMGKGLKRRFFTFARKRDPAELVAWKLESNELEARFALEWTETVSPSLPTTAAPRVLRPVNIDPGYITAAKLVLASTKDFAHRIYMRDGIYAEITLMHRKTGWVSHDFTFPDFKAPTYHAFLDAARARHMKG